MHARARDLQKMVFTLYERLRACGAFMEQLLRMLGDAGVNFDVSQLLLNFNESIHASMGECERVLKECQGLHVISTKTRNLLTFQPTTNP